MQDAIHIFEETNQNANQSTPFTMESVRSMVKQMNEIDDDIKRLREDKKELFSDFIEQYNVPKKEVMTAIRMLKGDIDPEITTDIYTNIADLVE
tara:strand:- start:71 stop:352 length:282 start_codon:yes stop_codon:yes gene_type:complete